MPSYDVKCTACGRTWERWSPIADRYAACDFCSGPVVQEFKHSVQGTPFIPYFDIGLGQQIDSLPERKKAMRNAHMDYRDHPSAGELSARRDRAHEARREQAKS